MRILLLILLILIPFAAHAVDLGKEHLLEHDGYERSYYLTAPKGKGPHPLVVVLHGGTGSAYAAAKMTGFSELAKKKKFIVAYPEGTGRMPTWNAGKCCGYAMRRNVDDVGFIHAMIAEIKKKHKIDNARIYAAGMSNGGMMAYRLACEMSETFTAVAVVSGAMNTYMCKPGGRPSIAIFHAIDDQNVLYNGGPTQKGLRAMLHKEPTPDASVTDAVQFWMAHNYCRKFPQEERFQEYTVANYFCAEGRDLRLYMLASGGHSWPGGKKLREEGDDPLQALDATEEIWRFFDAHPPRPLF